MAALKFWDGTTWKIVTGTATAGSFAGYQGTVVPSMGGSSSAAGLMMGLAGLITPTVTGRILMTATGVMGNSTAAGGCGVGMRWGVMGTAPANGAALIGNPVGGPALLQNNPVSLNVPFALTALVTGLTLGAQIWIDISASVFSSGTTTIAQAAIVAVELQ